MIRVLDASGNWLKPVLNPFTAPAGYISGLTDAWTPLKNSIFSGPITHLLSVLCVLIKVLLRTGAKKKTKRLKGFKFHASIRRF